MSVLNPYREWLGIPDATTTPNHYRLLGLRLFEDTSATILAAANRLSGIVQSQFSGPYVIEARRLLSEIETARICLTDPDSKATYDAKLRQQLSSAPVNPVATPGSDEIDPLLPPTAMSWRGSAGASPLPPSQVPAAMPPQSYGAGSVWPTPAAATPASWGNPNTPAGVMPYPPLAAPVAAPVVPTGTPPAMPPGGFPMAGNVMMGSAPVAAAAIAYPPSAAGMAYPQAASPTPFLPPGATAAAPFRPAAAVPVAMAAPTVPIYAAAGYPQAAAVPVAAPPVTPPHQSLAAPTVPAPGGGPEIVAPRMRLTWQKRKPPTPAIILAGTTAVLVVVAIIVVAANGPGKVDTPAVTPRQVAQEPQLFNIPTRAAPEKTERTSNSRTTAPEEMSPRTVGGNERPSMPAMDVKPAVAGSPPAAPVPAPTPVPATPAPAPSPPPAAMPDAKKEETVTAVLNRARLALAENDVALARRNVAAARAAEVASRTDEIDRVEVLAKYTEDFWKAVREGIKGLEIGGQFAVKDSFVGIVEVQSESLILRIQGQNKTFEIIGLPPAIAYALAESWLRKDDPATKIILGTYQAINPRGDREKARELWQMASMQGAKIAAEQLLPELNVPLPNPEAMPAVAESVKPGADGRFPTPGAAAQTQARTEVRQMFEADFAEAKDPASKAPLAIKLLERAEQPSDPPALRYLMLMEAGKLAAEAGDYDRMSAAIDKLAEQFSIEAIQLKADTLFEAARVTEGAEANQSLANAALAVCDEAVLSDKVDAALKIARTALGAARKGGDPDLVKLCTAREKEVRELKK